jgi:hypothetical protein
MTDPRIRVTATDETKAAFASVAGNLDRLKGSALALKAGIAGLAASFAGLAIVQNFQSAVDAADKLDELSQKIGISAETLSGFGLAIKLGGTDLDSFSGGVKKLAVNMAEAQRGAGDAADAFKAIGVSVENGSGGLRNVDDVLLDIAARFDATADGANKTALAVAIFGKAGADLVPFLNQGKEGIEGLRKEAERLGLIVSSDTARAAGQLKDNLDVLAESAKKTATSLLAALTPALVKITEQMRLGAQQGGFFIGILHGMRESLIQLTTNSTAKELDQVNAALREQLVLAEKLEAGGQTPRRKGTLGLDRSDQLGRVRSEIEELKRRSVELQTLLQFETPGGLNAGVAAPPKPQAPSLPKKGEKASDDFESTLKGLKQQAEAAEALTEYEKILAGIESGRIKLSTDPKIAQAQKEQLTYAAALVTQAQADKELREGAAKATEDAAKASNEAQKTEAERLNALREKYIATIDPIAKYRADLKEIQDLEDRGKLSREESETLTAAAEASIEKLRVIRDDTEKTKGVAEELGLVFVSAFEDAVAGGGKFSDILKGIEKDLLRLGTRELITKPAGEFLSGLFKSPGGSGGGDLFSKLIEGAKGLFGFANGGSFTVGGGGGVDSQVVAFRATPGERVSIAPPGVSGAGAMAVTMNFAINGSADRSTQAQLAQAAYSGLLRAQRRYG